MTAKQKKTFDVLIEIPKGSRNKYEYDFDLKKIRFDRIIYTMHKFIYNNFNQSNDGKH